MDSDIPPCQPRTAVIGIVSRISLSRGAAEPDQMSRVSATARAQLAQNETLQ